MNRRLSTIALLAIALVTQAGSCTPTATTTLVINTVAEVEVLATPAVNTASQYKALPNCPAPKGGLCSTQANRDKLDAAVLKLSTAIHLARSNTGTVAAAVSAVAALIAATPPVK